MERRTLGRTGLEVSLLSYGSGGYSSLGQPARLSAAAQDRLIRRCIDLGINLFDTSAGYGESEGILGRALQGVPRNSYLLCTKWSHHENMDDPDGANDLALSMDSSLSKLGTDYVDIMMFHGLRADQYPKVVDRFYPTKERLREAGKLRFVGLSEQFSEDPAHRGPLMALQNHPDLWDVVMLKYGILNQHADRKVLPLALQRDVGVINMAAVRVRLPDPQKLEETIADWKGRRLLASDGLPERRPLDWLIHDDVFSVIDAGYKFAADHPAISTVLTGTANVSHLEANARAIEVPRLDDQDTARLKRLLSHIVEYA